MFDAAFEHTVDLPFGSITGRIDGKYSSHYYYDVFNTSDTKSPSYFIGNLSAVYTPPSQKWTFQLYVRNFTDAAILTYAARNYVSYWNTYEFAPPLTFGGRFQYNF